jgi:general secretion pathway protein A
MYLSYYNLKEKPFQITADPKFLWLGDQHQEALSTLVYGVRESKGFLLLTGEVGTGKTVLVNRLVSMINVAANVAAIPDPGLETLDFFNCLSDAFEMGRTFASKGDFLAHLRKFLLGAAAKNKKVLLIIDEAQRLNHELLEEIRLLSNIELKNRKLINIFFVGQTEFNNILIESRNKAVRHRIAVRYHITDLSIEDTLKYITHRLKIAGTTQKIFTSTAINEIYSFAEGNPRLTNIICDHALLTGYSSDLQMIDADVIKECAAELRIPDESINKKRIKKQRIISKAQSEVEETTPKPSFVIAAISIAIIALMLAVAGYLVLSLKSEKTLPWSLEELAPQKPKGVSEGKSPSSRIEADRTSDVKSDVKTATETRDAGMSFEIGRLQKESQPRKIQQELDLTHIEKIVVYFSHDSNDLPDRAYQTLDRIAAALIENSVINISIKGYTDSSGDLGYNISISNFRANIIKSYFIGKGVNHSRITALGLGPENPIASNETTEGRKQNRRVELEFSTE